MAASSSDISKLSTRDSIQVVCRFRPLNKIELGKSSGVCIDIPEHPPGTVQVEDTDGLSQAHTFSFDSVHGSTASQQEVYDVTGKGLVEAILEGYNACLLAYGQTGAGKTFRYVT